MQSKFQYLENEYVSFTLRNSTNNVVEASISVLKPFPAFYLFPLVDILARGLITQNDLAITMPEDVWLKESLIALGCKTQTISGETLLTLSSENLVYPLSYKAIEYFKLASNQERFYFGLATTTSNYRSRVRNPFAGVISHGKRKTSDFDGLLGERASATEFHKAPEKLECDRVLKDCYYLNETGDLPVGSAGGISAIQFILVTGGSEDLAAGVYEVKEDTNAWISLQSEDYTRAIWECSFQQEYTENCKCYLIALIDLEEMSSKYGSRSHRFSFIGLGGVLERMHLSCTSYGVGFRIIGGFDESVIKLLLGDIAATKIVGALIALGKANDTRPECF